MKWIVNETDSDGIPKGNMARMIDTVFSSAIDELGLKDAAQNIFVTYKLSLSEVGSAGAKVLAAVGSTWDPSEDLQMRIAIGPRLQILRGISHEMVHVHQSVRGDLGLYRDEEKLEIGTKWKGKPWKEPSKGQMFIEAILEGSGPRELQQKLYRSQPWEAEAFEKMDRLAVKAFDRLSFEDKIWVFGEGEEG